MDGFARQQHYRAIYRDTRNDWTESVKLFREEIRRALRPGASVLDLGCGHLGLHGDDLSCAPGALVAGVEPNADALRANHVIPHRVCAAGELLPFAGGSFDVVASAWVLEHLDTPGLVFAEVARVLKPGGRFLVLTPNAWNYNAWLIRAVPNSWHDFFTRRLYSRGAGDTYPVRYRANSARTLQQLVVAAGFRSLSLRYNGDPSYIAFNRPLFALAAAMERIYDRPALNRLRVHIIASATR